jgi:protein SCO1
MKTRVALIAGVLACAAGSVVMLDLALAGSDGRHARPALVGPLMPPGMHAVDFRLHDQAGRATSLAPLRGRVVVIAFLHSLCHSTCPITVQTIRGALDDLGPARRDVEVLGISVAPREDTPRHVRRFVAMQRARRFLHYLTGTPAALRAVWHAYGIHPLTHGEDHTAFVLLIDRRGVVRIGYPVHEMTPEDLTNDLRVLTTEKE